MRQPLRQILIGIVSNLPQRYILTLYLLLPYYLLAVCVCLFDSVLGVHEDWQHQSGHSVLLAAFLFSLRTYPLRQKTVQFKSTWRNFQGFFQLLSHLTQMIPKLFCKFSVVKELLLIASTEKPALKETWLVFSLCTVTWHNSFRQEMKMKDVSI